MSRKTEWIRANEPPTISGVYERALGDNRGPYSYFDVSKGVWYGWHVNIAGAASSAGSKCVSSVQDVAWRGLAKEPK